MVDMGGSGGGVVTPSVQQYCLKWNNHQNNLLRVFVRLLGQEQFTDVTIAAEGRRIRCHKMVLSACSSYFEQLFLSYSENNQIIILKDTPYQDIAAIVEFMYRGEINVSQDRLSSLLKTAENLKVKGLAEVSSDEKKPPGQVGKGNNSSASHSNNNTINSNNNSTSTNNNNMMSSSNSHASSLGQASLVSSSRGGSGVLGASSAAASVAALASAVLPGHHLAGAHPRLAGPPPMQMMGRPCMSPMADSFMNGEMKRKRGRPRTLDGPEDETVFNPKISFIPGISLSSRVTGSPAMSPLQAALNRPLSQRNTATPSAESLKINHKVLASEDGGHHSSPGTSPSMSPALVKQEMGVRSVTPTSIPGDILSSNLTPEKVANWGIIKMNDYLITGTRQQYWEEVFVKHVMEAVKNKELDMKSAAELLGVSYGTLYGRYRETFGYLKHAWNISGRPQKKSTLWTEPRNKAILESLSSGAITMKQAAEALSMEPAMLAYHLDLKTPEEYRNGSDQDVEDDIEEEDDDREGSMVMEVQPDIIVGEEEEDVRGDEAFESIADEDNGGDDEVTREAAMADKHHDGPGREEAAEGEEGIDPVAS